MGRIRGASRSLRSAEGEMIMLCALFPSTPEKDLVFSASRTRCDEPTTLLLRTKAQAKRKGPLSQCENAFLV